MQKQSKRPENDLKSCIDLLKIANGKQRPKNGRRGGHDRSKRQPSKVLALKQYLF